MENEQKKEYVRPELFVLEIKAEGALLLVGSDQSDAEEEIEVDFVKD